jgi:hypothetical protein
MNQYSISRKNLLNLLNENPTCENISFILCERDNSKGEELIQSVIKPCIIKDVGYMANVITEYEVDKAPCYNSNDELKNLNNIISHDTLILFCNKDIIKK